MFGGWRARLHYWSRHTTALKKTALWIVVAGFVSAWLFVTLAPERQEKPQVDLVEQAMRNQWQRVYHSTEADPRALSRWLRHLLSRVEHLCDVAGIDYPTPESFEKDGKLGIFEVRPLLRKHATDEDMQRTFETFIQAWLTGGAANPHFLRLQELAQGERPPPLANELHAALLVEAGHEPAALGAFVREGQLYRDAKGAREDAVRLALKLKDTEALRFFAVEPGWLAGVSESLQYHAGWELHDPWLIGKGTLGHRLDNLRILPVLQTLLAAGLWYAILVLQSAPRPWRWALPLLPIVAGIISIWPTLWVDAWQETALKMTEEAPFPDDLWFWIMGVGLREEGCKLALFALFLPWLLRRRAPGLALMTGAFVGLGFALEENLGYYEERGGAVALGRFLTANFFHAALSGIAAHALYDMLRSRFARADKFLLTFLAVVVVHGLYDYAIASGIDGMGYLTMAMLAFTAWHFLDLVAREGPGARQWVAPAAVLLIGTALLIASVFWFSAIQVRTKEGLYAAALECVGVLPVLFIYWRRLN